jgi:DNA-directed RNA polymerase specialized sigma24 family protein
VGERDQPIGEGRDPELGPDGPMIGDARDGSATAQRRVYFRSIELMRRLARSLGLRGCDLPDAAHDAAAQALLDLPACRAESRFATWLYAIARHQQIRRQSQGRAAEAVIPSGNSIDAPEAETPDLLLLVRENLCDGVRAVLTAPERRGFAFLAVRILGVRANAVAELLGCRANAVHQLAHKGAAAVRLATGAEGGPGRVAACGSCRGPLVAIGAGRLPGECPMRWFMSLTDDEGGLRAGWEAYLRLRGGGGRIPDEPG